jgi:hypothetical protein
MRNYRHGFLAVAAIGHPTRLPSSLMTQSEPERHQIIGLYELNGQISSRHLSG